MEKMEKRDQDKSHLPALSVQRHAQTPVHDKSLRLSPALGSQDGPEKERPAALLTGVTPNESAAARQESEEADSYIFEVNLMPVETLAKNIQGIVPMDEFTAAKFHRVKNNIIAALTFLRKNVKKPNDTTKDKNSLKTWKDLIGCEFNQHIINDGFWLVILKKNSHKFLRGRHSLLKKKTASSRNTAVAPPREFSDLYYQIEEALLTRMACNYHDMLEHFVGEEFELFFQLYFDIVAQGVFYSFFYAFPKSRQEFDDNYKKYVFSVFAELFTDMEISYHSQFVKGYYFIENWRLDLGAGDVLKQSNHRLRAVQKDSENNESEHQLPQIKKPRVQPLKKKTTLKNLRYSPILSKYLELKKYKTRNFLKPNTMKLTPYDESQKDYEKKLEEYNKVIEGAEKLSNDFKKLIDNGELNKEMYDKIKQIKKKTLEHIKNLNEKRREENENGASEYANYIVSMGNAANNYYIVDQ